MDLVIRNINAVSTAILAKLYLGSSLGQRYQSSHPLFLVLLLLLAFILTMIVEDEDLVNDGNAFENGVV
jgi:hypothetical protein